MKKCPFCGPIKCNQPHCSYTEKLKCGTVDLVGQKFGHLTVLEYKKVPDLAKYYWICKCKCGNITRVKTKDLLDKKIRSCGCLKGTK